MGISSLCNMIPYSLLTTSKLECLRFVGLDVFEAGGCRGLGFKDVQ